MSVTAAVCCTVLFKSIAACAYAGEEGKLIDAMVHGGDAGGGLLSLLPKLKSDTPEKHATRLINAVADDLTAYLETERVNDREALLMDLNQFGPAIIAHNAPGLTEMIVKQGGGDWQKATVLVLDNIPESETDGRVGEGLNAFRSSAHNRPHRAALTHVLNHLHRALFAPQDMRHAIYAAMQSDIQARLGRIEETGEDTNAKVNSADAKLDLILEMMKAKSSLTNIQPQDIEPARKTLSELQEAQETGDEGAEAALAEILESGDTDKATAFYQKRMAERDSAIQEYKMANAADWRSIGALAFLHDTHTALEAYEKAVELNPDNADGWNELGHLLHRIGELERAITAYKKVEAIGNKLDNNEICAVAYGNLGTVYPTLGDLDGAEEMFRKGLKIDEELGRKEGMASKYGNLGNVYQIRGKLDGAEEMYRRSLKLNDELGRQESMASDYCNLGEVYRKRGDLDGAEEMYNKSLELFEVFGHKEGMASNYGNLGNVYKTRGDLDGAEAMYNKSLKLNEELGLKEGMANQYGNLGAVCEKRGDVEPAREYWQKSLALFTEIGAAPKIEVVQGWLDGLPPE